MPGMKLKSGRHRPPRKLDFKQLARMLLDYEGGESKASLARTYGITAMTVAYWTPYAGLSECWLKRVRELEHANWELTRTTTRAHAARFAATALIKRLEPRIKRRSLYAASLQAGLSMSREEANKICGLSHGVGHQGFAQEGDHRLVALMRRYLEENPGIGFRGMFDVLLRDEHCLRGHACKLYQQARLQRRWRMKPVPVPARVARRIIPALRRDQAWSMDFLIDALPTGKRYHVLSVIDDFSREYVVCLILPKATALAMVQTLEAMRARGRKPLAIRTDNGGQFKSDAYAQWADRHGIRRLYSRPWHSNDNALVERLHGTLRREVLDWYRFRSLAEAQRMLDDWRVRYNMARPHLALHGLSPLQFAELYADK